MVFSSSIFLFLFLPVFLLVYHLVTSAYKNLVIVLASLVFYAWGAPLFVFFLLALMSVDFYVVRSQYLCTTPRRKKILLGVSVALNLGALAYFKYANFFVENLNGVTESVFHHRIPWIDVALPIGISFYTFHALSYSIDVYRGVHRPMEKLSEYILYILAFPQLIAGPIIRFNTMADQITSRKETSDDKLFGFFRFSIGLAKKMLVANSLGLQADLILNSNPASLSTTAAWVGIVAYTFQLYFDFSAYTDMALGLGKIIGFSFPENFNSPYTAQNITDFWRRWHISLSRWMRDYLYIPLGGNRVKTKSRAYLNLWIVFLLSGLWHGASWNFLIWGAYHGLFLILDKLFLIQLLDKFPTFVRVAFTFFVVMIGWVFFRIEKFDEALRYLCRLFDLSRITVEYYNTSFYFFLFIAASFSFITLSKVGKALEIWTYEITSYNDKAFVLRCVLAFLLFVFSASFVASSGFNPFIYFRF